uniref:Uncharacterized protein n=1 Tax=Anguilla anguilla TaxID=7936 RepID=A0A0E9Q3G2_ANGAN
MLKAQGEKEVKIRGQTIRFVQDLPAKLRERGKEYLLIRQALDKHEIKSLLRYPSVLWVWKEGRRWNLQSADEALTKLKEAHSKACNL